MFKMKNENDEDLIEIINAYKNESTESPESIDKILRESIEESIKVVFGEELAPILLSSLFINSKNAKDKLDTQKFLLRLNDTLKNDAFHIQKMIEGKMLTKFHASELRKKMALPRLDDL